jgi:hypothetical protein
MSVTIYAVQSSWRMGRGATARHGYREVNGNARITALLPIGDIFQEVFGLGFEACCAEAEGMILSIGVTVSGTSESTINTPWRRCIENNSTR